MLFKHTKTGNRVKHLGVGSDTRVRILNMSTGEREWIDRLDFHAQYAPLETELRPDSEVRAFYSGQTFDREQARARMGDE